MPKPAHVQLIYLYNILFIHVVFFKSMYYYFFLVILAKFGYTVNSIGKKGDVFSLRMLNIPQLLKS